MTEYKRTCKTDIYRCVGCETHTIHELVVNIDDEDEEHFECCECGEIKEGGW